MTFNEAESGDLLKEYDKIIKELYINVGDNVLHKSKGKGLVEAELTKSFIAIRLENSELLVCNRWDHNIVKV